MYKIFLNCEKFPMVCFYVTFNSFVGGILSSYNIFYKNNSKFSYKHSVDNRILVLYVYDDAIVVKCHKVNKHVFMKTAQVSSNGYVGNMTG